MTLWLWVLIAILAVTALAAAAWFYFLFREDSIATGTDDAQAGESDTAAAAPAEHTAADAAAPAAAGSDDPTDPAAYGLDPEEWATMSARTYRKGRLRGLFRGGRRLGALAGEPAAVFEHRHGDLLIGHDAGRPYGGRPAWAEVSALTLQMGLATLRWPGAEVHGAVRYHDRSVPVAYSPDLFEDLRRASGRGRTLPDVTELQPGTGDGQAA